MFFENIPDILRCEQRWSVWKRNPDSGKVAYRVPKDQSLNSYRCRSNTAADWVSFDEALEYLVISKHSLHPHHGLSFALGNGWLGFDFDDVIVDGHMHPKADEWLGRLGGYSEVSQSGKGIKSILIGSLSLEFLGSAETGRQFKSIPEKGMATEVYDKRRFFFLTGNGSGIPVANQSIIDEICQELLDLKEAMTPKPKRRFTYRQADTHSIKLSDQSVLEKIQKSKQASKFHSLWSGNIGTYDSASEADMALTSILMFWCGNDTQQVERIFSRSELAKRAKWDRDDYRARTLTKAESAEVYKPYISQKNAEAIQRLRGESNE